MSVFPSVLSALAIMNTAVANAFNNSEIDMVFANVYPTKQIVEIIGNILAESDEYCKLLLDNNLLQLLHNIYYDQNNVDLLLKLEVLFCWMNIAGGQFSQVLFNSTNIQDLLANVAALQGTPNDVDYEMARRSMVIICNFICECDDNVFALFYSNVIVIDSNFLHFEWN